MPTARHNIYTRPLSHQKAAVLCVMRGAFGNIPPLQINYSAEPSNYPEKLTSLPYRDTPFLLSTMIASIRWMTSTAFTAAASSGEQPLSNTLTRHYPQTSSGNMVTAAAAATDGHERINNIINNNNTIHNCCPQSVLRELSIAVTNVTRALLPLVPLIAEAPALVEHARRTLPWARTAWRWWPFAFIALPYPLERSARFITVEAFCRPVSTVLGVTPHPQGRNANFDLAAASCQTLTSQAVRGPDVKIDGRPGSSIPADRSSSALNRREVVRSMAVRFSGLCGTVVMPMALPAGRPIAGIASAVTTETTREKGSYDSFAEGYDDLDGGWAASVLGIEVREFV